MSYDAGTKTLTGSTTHITQVFTLTIDNSGNYVFTLKAPLDHPVQQGAGFENNLQLDFGVTITDGDNDPVSGVICINVDDDIPVAVGEGNLATVEEASASSIIGTVAGLLANDAFGADGEHATNPISIVSPGSLGGTITVDGSGNLVYTPPASVDSDSVETFTYLITDGDGDTSQASFTVTVTDDSIPVIEQRALDVAVDEDGLALANVDAPLATETDGNELAVNTGTVSIDFGGDLPADPDAAFTFLLTGLDGQLQTTNGTPVTFVVDGPTGDLVGTAAGNPAIRIAITGVLPTGGGEVQYTYQVTLSQALKHASLDTLAGDDTENLLSLLNVQFQVTDSNGDQLPAPGSFNVTILDDVPDATDEAQANVVEGQIEVGSFDFVAGADGAKVTAVNGVALDFTTNGPAGYSNPINLGYGTLEVMATGAYKFTAGNPLDNTPPPVINGTFTVTDGDGDSDTANFSFKLLDGNFPYGDEAFAAVDDDGLTGGNALSTSGDDDANAGDDPADTSEKTFTGNLGGYVGLDVPGVYSFSEMNGDAWTLGQESGTFSWAGNILTANIVGGPRNGTALFQVEITNVNTGAFKVTLLDNVVHQAGPNEENTNGGTDNQLVLSYRITDADELFDDNGTLTINFDDDAPTATAEATQPVAEGASLPGSFDFVAGADGATVTHIGNTLLTFVTNGPTGYSDAVNLGYGTIVVKATGEYIFTANAVIDNDPVPVLDGTFTVTDGDGDTVTKAFQFTLTDDNKPTGAQVAAKVDDDGLTGGNAAGQGDDINANTGDDPADTSEKSFTGNLGGSFGGDGAGSYSFANLAGQPWSLGQESGTFGWAGNTLTANIVGGTRGGTPLFQVVINPTTGAYTVTLLDNVLHAQGPNAENVVDPTVALAYTITDSDNSTASGSLTITFDDDAPTLVIVDSPTTVNESTNFTTGSWSLAAGADGVTSVDVTVNGVTQSLSMSVGTNFVTFPPVAGQPGTLVVKADGTWTYAANTVTVDTPVSLTIAATDGDGDTTTDTQNFTIKNVSNPLSAGAFGGTVEEEQLEPSVAGTYAVTADGNEDIDDASGLDTDNSPAVLASYTGSFGVTGGDGSFTYAFNVANGTAVQKTVGGALTSGGAAVVYHNVDADTVVGYVNVSGAGFNPAVDRVIFSLDITTGGNYTFTLYDNVDHPTQTNGGPTTEENIGINLNNLVVVNDGFEAPLNLQGSIAVIDDVPVVTNSAANAVAGVKPSVNVVLVIDTSGSMGSGSTPGTAMYLAKQAAINLLANPDVTFNEVMVVNFGSSSAGTGWTTAGSATTYIGGLTGSGNTNYDAALNTVTTGWGAGPSAATQTLVYFISDGAPNPASSGIDGTEQTAWETFLANAPVGGGDVGVDTSYAIGVGSGVSSANFRADLLDGERSGS